MGGNADDDEPSDFSEQYTLIDPAVLREQGGGTWPSLPSGDSDIPRTLPDRYTSGNLLGRGGMGEVVSVRDKQIGRNVAVKRLKGESPTKAAISRFLREARIQGRLEHPAVVPVHDLAYDDTGQPFFVMKQLAGVTLADVLRALNTSNQGVARKFPRQRMLRAFVDVCLAIEFAHTRGVVHRDLKPSNIVVGDFGEVYVLDWGIAHVMADPMHGGKARTVSFGDIQTFDQTLMADGMVLGSPGYMSPEQIKVEHDLDGRSDIYALGCILFEILTHQMLHETGLAGIALALTGVDARPSVRAPELDIPPELEAIVLKATALDRRDRYATARDLGDAVQRFLDGDRDIELRRSLATAEIDKARAAIESGNNATQRRAAMRAAARALALDPANAEPADLVGRLMLEPPRDVPPEVEEAVARVDDDALYNARKLIFYAAIAYLAFMPIIYIIGFRDLLLIAGGVAIATAMAILSLRATRDQVKIIAYTGLLGNGLMTALFAWALTPFFIAPSLGVITAMALATHPRVAKGWVLVVVTSLAVLAPLILEGLGMLRRTMMVRENTLTLFTVGNGLDPQTATTALVLYVVALMTMSVILSKFLIGDRRAAQRMVQVQAWQLRQLVPQLSAGASSETMPAASVKV